MRTAFLESKWKFSDPVLLIPYDMGLCRFVRKFMQISMNSTSDIFLPLPASRAISATACTEYRSRFSGRGWGQQLFSFQSPAVHRIARTSSLNCLPPVEILTKPPIHWIASPLFTEKNLFFSQWKVLRRIPFNQKSALRVPSCQWHHARTTQAPLGW